MSTKKKVLFGDDQFDQDEGDLKINPDFARRFEHNKRRELLDKAKAQDLLNSDDDSEASVEEEDDDGALINANVEKKFLETIAMIRSNDPKLKAVEGEVFRDEDFESDEGAVVVKGSSKKLTYKDQIREDVLNRGAAEEESESD
jgi:protein KRI1